MWRHKPPQTGVATAGLATPWRLPSAATVFAKTIEPSRDSGAIDLLKVRFPELTTHPMQVLFICLSFNRVSRLFRHARGGAEEIIIVLYNVGREALNWHFFCGLFRGEFRKYDCIPPVFHEA